MSFFEYMISLLELKEKFTIIANYGLLIFSFSLFILTLSFIIYGFMSISILVILYYIILIVSLKFVDRLTEDKNLSPRQSRAYGQLFLEIFLFSSIGLTLMLAYSGLTKNIDPNLLAGIPFLIMFNFFILLGILKAIDVIRQCGQQFHSFEIFTFIITPLSNKYVGCKGYIRKNAYNHLVNLLEFQGKWKSIDASLCFKLLNPCSA